MTDGADNKDKVGYEAEVVSRFFDEYGLKEWNRLVQNPVEEVNLYLHTHYLNKYLPSGKRVLEIGASAGRFTQVLARLGARILVADISATQLELNRQYMRQLGFTEAIEDWVQVDCCDLSRFTTSSFEAVVAFGGLFSYAFDRREAALRECLRVLQPGGILFLSVMSLWGSAHRALPGVLEVSPVVNLGITTSGDLAPGLLAGRSGPPVHMFRASELVSWLEAAGLQILVISASGCLAGGWVEKLGPIRENLLQWQELLRMELEASASPGALDMGTHIIAIARN